jgi:hypothetical protein
MRCARLSAFPANRRSARKKALAGRPGRSAESFVEGNSQRIACRCSCEGRNANCPRATFVAGAGQPGYWIPVTLGCFSQPVWQEIQYPPRLGRVNAPGIYANCGGSRGATSSRVSHNQYYGTKISILGRGRVASLPRHGRSRSACHRKQERSRRGFLLQAARNRDRCAYWL